MDPIVVGFGASPVLLPDFDRLPPPLLPTIRPGISNRRARGILPSVDAGAGAGNVEGLLRCDVLEFEVGLVRIVRTVVVEIGGGEWMMSGPGP